MGVKVRRTGGRNEGNESSPTVSRDVACSKLGMRVTTRTCQVGWRRKWWAREGSKGRERSMRAWRTYGRSNDGSEPVFKGINLLEWSGGVLPQGWIVHGAKTTWNGIWLALMQELAPQKKDGSYERPKYAFDKVIVPRANAEFPVQSGRYHLYVGNPCPWCHRVELVLALRNLHPHISVSHMLDDPEKASRGGWIFEGRDPVFGARDLRGVYMSVEPNYTGRCTAPFLVDKKLRKAVSNESSKIVRMLNDFDIGKGPNVDLCPENLRGEIDELNGFVYENINNGVYKCGFATSQEAYDRAERNLHDALKKVDERLQTRKFLHGDKITESDVFLYPTAVRFDMVYAGLFRCGRRRIRDYTNIQRWMEDVHALARVHETFDAEGARKSYYRQMFPLNPSLIVPGGPTATDVGLVDPPSAIPNESSCFHYKSEH